MTARKHAPPLEEGWVARIGARISWRFQAIGVAVLCLGLSLGMGGLVLGDFIHSMESMARGDKMIEVFHQTFVLLILAPPILLLGLLLPFAKRTVPVAGPSKRKTAKQRAEEKRASRWGGRFVLFLFVSILVASLSPIPQFYIVNYLAAQRGYVSCPSPFFSRRQPDRWALPGPHGRTEYCPGSAGR